ncbi:glycosyltransferase [Streptomyces sp. NPDC058741]|uniref:glycosyltransferase n=1 Tax=unclassified Streptomyces TaxID=2593676 RepID=UPI0036C611EF
MTPDGPRILHVSTTDKLGGVSEVVRSELPYLVESGWQPRWVTANDLDEAHEAAFVLHNALYGVPVGDFPQDRVRSGVERFLGANAEAVVAAARDADVVVLHDPMVLNLASAIRPVTPRIAWRCHVGSEHLDMIDQDAVSFLRPQLDVVDHLLFPHRGLIWPGWEDDERILVVPPGIDPRSWKNRDLPEETYAALWSDVHAARGTAGPTDIGGEDTHIVLDDHGTGGLRAPESPFVLQVSRWDPLKGQLGVVRAFADLARQEPDVELVLVGPHIDDRENYPVNRKVWGELMRAREELAGPVRERVHVWRFGPLRRTGEDLALNVLRRYARTVVQNSVRESFGLTVAEAMWRGAVVVGSDVDGISEQMEHDVNGLLTPYTDGGGPWAETVRRSLTDEAGRLRWSKAARATVEERFLSRAGTLRQTAAFTGASPGAGR